MDYQWNTTYIVNVDLFNVETNTQYTISYYALDGTLTGGALNMNLWGPILTVMQQLNQNIDKQNTFITTTQTNFLFNISVGRTFNNYQFKLKLEKGSTATPYTVPGQIPQYKIVGEE